MLGTIMVLISTLLTFALEGLVVAGIVLLVVRLIQKKKVPPETAAAQEQERKSLAEALKEHRLRCGMTQEFAAESLGVSRQAVSKWENGTSDPSTTNLLALARLYGVSAEELLKAAAKETRT